AGRRRLARQSGCRTGPEGAQFMIRVQNQPRERRLLRVPETDHSHDIPHLVLVAAIAVALLALGFYLRTLHPGVGPSLDSMELQIAAKVGGVIHPPGSPQYLMLGKLVMDLPLDGSAAYQIGRASCRERVGRPGDAAAAE